MEKQDTFVYKVLQLLRAAQFALFVVVATCILVLLAYYTSIAPGKGLFRMVTVFLLLITYSNIMAKAYAQYWRSQLA